MESINSPTTVATNNLKDRIPDIATTKLQSPPMMAMPTENACSKGSGQFNRSSSLPDPDTLEDHLDNNSSVDGLTSKDDIDAHCGARRRETLADFKGKLSIKGSTRNLLGRMDDAQLNVARGQFQRIKKERSQRGLDMGTRGRRPSSKQLADTDCGSGRDTGSRLSGDGESSRCSGRVSTSSRRSSDESLDDGDVILEGEGGKLKSIKRDLKKQGSRNLSQSLTGASAMLGGSLKKLEEDLELSDDDEDFDVHNVGQLESPKSVKADRKRMSQSAGADAYDLRHEMDSTSSDESSDEGDDALDDKLREFDEVKAAKADRRRMSKSLGTLQTELGNISLSDDEDEEEESKFHQGPKRMSQMLEGFDAVNDIADKTFERIVKRNATADADPSLPQATNTSFPEPESQRRRSRRRGMMATSGSSRRERRSGMMSTSGASGAGSWKPLSSNQQDPELGEDGKKEEEGETKEENKSGRSSGIGNFWNKLTTSFNAGQPTTLDQLPTSSQDKDKRKQPKKDITGATYFRRGKRKANKCQFLQAVALYNFALVRQREEHGENSIDCGTTLNDIGVCWMMLGERYPALTAFEEALYIRQKAFGDGAMEVAETTNNIWMILHEEHCEMETMMDEGDEAEED